MKQYKKTVWVDGQTPINASNLNKIETALSEISKLALAPSDLTSLNEKEIKVGSDCGKITFGIGENILRTDNINAINIINSNGENSDKKSDITFVVSSSDEMDSMFPGTYSFNKDGVMHFPIAHEASILRENGDTVGHALSILENLSVRSGSVRSIDVAFKENEESLKNLPGDGLVFVFSKNQDLKINSVDLSYNKKPCCFKTSSKLVFDERGRTVEETIDNLKNELNNLENKNRILINEIESLKNLVKRINPDCFKAFRTITWVILEEDSLESTRVVSEYLSGSVNIEAPQFEGFEIEWDSEIPREMPDEDIEIHGKKIRKSYSVTFKVDGNIVYTGEHLFGSNLNDIIPTNVEKEGYTFSGWNNLTEETVPAYDVIFEGNYSINTYTVNLWRNSIDIESEGESCILSQEVEFNSELNLEISYEIEGELIVAPNGWCDKDGIQYTSMPARNLDLFPAQNNEEE